MHTCILKGDILKNVTWYVNESFLFYLISSYSYRLLYKGPHTSICFHSLKQKAPLSKTLLHLYYIVQNETPINRQYVNHYIKIPRLCQNRPLLFENHQNHWRVSWLILYNTLGKKIYDKTETDFFESLYTVYVWNTVIFWSVSNPTESLHLEGRNKALDPRL